MLASVYDMVITIMNALAAMDNYITYSKLGSLHSIMDGLRVYEATPFLQELLEVNDCQGKGFFFFFS